MFGDLQEGTMNKRLILADELDTLIQKLAATIGGGERRNPVHVYGVPRGGVPVAMAVCQFAKGYMTMVDSPDQADVIVDDLVDSGATRSRYADRFPGKRFEPLLDKSDKTSPYHGQWIIFPWESDPVGSAVDVFTRLLQFIGENPEREGLRDTPARAVRAWEEWTSGYGKSPRDVVKSFGDGAENVDEQVVLSEIPFFSHCEHHLAPFFGTVAVGYLPDRRIIGLSKVCRIVDVFAHRLQVQERLTVQIAEALEELLGARGVAVVIEARHFCMESRGVCKPGVTTRTSAVRGRHVDPTVRGEFLRLAGL